MGNKKVNKYRIIIIIISTKKGGSGAKKGEGVCGGC